MALGLAVLGATGSIGLNTLDVAARHPDRYRIVALSAWRDSARLAALCREHRPAHAVVGDAAAARDLAERLGPAAAGIRIAHGAEALAEVATLPEAELVMAGIVGAAGLLPTLAAVRAGKRVLLANKEPLVMAGALFMREVERCGATLLPVDSEHNAVFQCLPRGYRCGTRPPGVRRVVLTASGGPFRELPLAQLPAVTPEQALRHPNWVMGPKISVDSASMMNKGLELIEAAWLFGLEAAGLEILLHPQSLVHALVEYADGSVLAQLGQPDMRTPIAHALAWPERISSGSPLLDLAAAGRLDFRAPETERYPCLQLARQALAAGGVQPVVLNAANEEAVMAFLQRRIGFMDLPDVIEHCLSQAVALPADAASAELAAILEVDAWARRTAQAALARRGREVAHV